MFSPVIPFLEYLATPAAVPSLPHTQTRGKTSGLRNVFMGQATKREGNAWAGCVLPGTSHQEVLHQAPESMWYCLGLCSFFPRERSHSF